MIRNEKKIKTAHIAVFALAYVTLSLSSFSVKASTTSGFDTPSGTFELPIAVQGQVGIDLVDGASTPSAMATTTNPPNVVIAGATKFNAAQSTTTAAGNACVAASEGFLSYDYTSHVPVFCNGSKWVVFVTTLGLNQSWQDVSAGRSFATTYTNTSVHPIEVSVASAAGPGNSQSTVTVNGVVTASCQAVTGTNCTVSTVVPPGSTYSASGTYANGQGGATGAIWAELLPNGTDN